MHSLKKAFAKAFIRGDKIGECLPRLLLGEAANANSDDRDDARKKRFEHGYTLRHVPLCPGGAGQS
jgi:hypothetical protein